MYAKRHLHSMTKYEGMKVRTTIVSDLLREGETYGPIQRVKSLTSTSWLRKVCGRTIRKYIYKEKTRDYYETHMVMT